MSFLSRPVLFGCLIIAAFPAHGELKKWVDEAGVTHYGDQIPTQYLRQKHQILSPQGVVVEEVPAAKTDAELLEEQRQAKLKEIEKQEKRKQAFKDRVLLDTYTTERDLIAARDERLTTVDSLITLTNTIIKDDTERLAKLKIQLGEYEKFNRPISQHMLEQRDILEKQIKDNQQYVVSQQGEREKIVEQFDRDVKRYRELKLAEMKRQQERERLRREQERKEQEFLNPVPESTAD